MHDILSECITHLMTESEDNVTKKVSDLDRVLIEQALFCTDGTDDCGENFLIEALYRYLDNDNPSYKLTSFFTTTGIPIISSTFFSFMSFPNKFI